MSEEPTKACVVVLRTEAKIRYLAFYPIRLIIKLFDFCSQYINWCIVRSMMRIFGFPITVALAFYTLKTMIDNPHPDNYIINLVGGCLVMVFILFILTAICWISTPYRERNVIESHLSELENRNRKRVM